MRYFEVRRDILPRRVWVTGIEGAIVDRSGAATDDGFKVFGYFCFALRFGYLLLGLRFDRLHEFGTGISPLISVVTAAGRTGHLFAGAMRREIRPACKYQRLVMVGSRPSSAHDCTKHAACRVAIVVS